MNHKDKRTSEFCDIGDDRSPLTVDKSYKGNTVILRLWRLEPNRLGKLELAEKRVRCLDQRADGQLGWERVLLALQWRDDVELGARHTSSLHPARLHWLDLVSAEQILESKKTNVVREET